MARNDRSGRWARIAALLCALLFALSISGCADLSAALSDDAWRGLLQDGNLVGAVDAPPVAASPGAEGLTEADLEWSSDYPDYYRVLGPSADPEWDFDGGEVRYGGLDGLGRSTWGGGWITGEMRALAKEAGRPDVDLPDPSGWPDTNPKVTILGLDGRRDYSGYALNRSHTVAVSIGGTCDVVGLVTGFRTQNVGDNSTPGGMAYTETLARDWLDENPDGALWYMATPVYVGDEPIPRAVVVDIRTDDGSIDQEVLVHNAANGYELDYETGEIMEAAR